MISLMASSGDLLSKMSLTSIRWPEKANERTSSTTSCRLWINSRKKSDTCATDPETSQIATIFDVSGSVAQVSDFFLLLIHSLHEVVDDVRSFAFSGHLIEVSDILDNKSPEE